MNSYGLTQTPSNYIVSQRREGRSWESLANRELEDDDFFIRQIRNGWPINIRDKWQRLVDNERVRECNVSTFDAFTDSASTETDGNKIFEKLKTPSLSYYLERLTDDGFDSSRIERNSKEVLLNIHRGMKDSNRIRGMILGMPRSSKSTSSMGIMSLAADIGWNLFIIVTGFTDQTIDYQKSYLTQRINTVNEQYTWMVRTLKEIDYNYGIRKNENNDLRDIILVPRREEELLHLKRMISRLGEIPDKRIMMIDEDLFRVGTDVYRFRNRLEGVDGAISSMIRDFSCSYLAYLKFTSNITIQFDMKWHPKSMFPCNFIYELEQPTGYYGPDKVFGEKGSLTNVVSDMESQMAHYYGSPSPVLPDSMLRSLLWFICTVAVTRYNKVAAPLSCLFVCSSRKENRSTLLSSIEKIFYNGYQQYEPLIRDVYNSESKKEDSLRSIGYDSIEEEVIKIFRAGSKRNDEEQKDFDGIVLCSDYTKRYECDIDTPPFPDYLKRCNMANGFVIIGGYSLQNGAVVRNISSVFLSESKAFRDSFFSIDYCCAVKKEGIPLPHLWISNKLNEHMKRAYLTESIIRGYARNNKLQRIIDLPEEYSKLIKDQKFEKEKVFDALEKNHCDRCGCDIEVGERCCRLDNYRYNIVCYNCYIKGVEGRKTTLENYGKKVDDVARKLFLGKILDLREVGNNDRIHSMMKSLMKMGIRYEFIDENNIRMIDYDGIQSFARSLIEADSDEELAEIESEYGYRWEWIANFILNTLENPDSTTTEFTRKVDYNLMDNTDYFAEIADKIKSSPNLDYLLSNQFKYRARDSEGNIWHEINENNKYGVFKYLIHSILDRLPNVNRYDNDWISFNGKEYHIQIILDEKRHYYADSENDIPIVINGDGIYCIGANMEKLDLFNTFGSMNDDYTGELYRYACTLFRCWDD